MVQLHSLHSHNQEIKQDSFGCCTHAGRYTTCATSHTINIRSVVNEAFIPVVAIILLLLAESSQICIAVLPLCHRKTRARLSRDHGGGGERCNLIQ